MITKAGFDFCFDPKACSSCGGRCCIGDRGDILVSKDELACLVDFFKLDFPSFEKSYLKKTPRGYSFIEIPFEKGYACVFFDRVYRKCSIYELRPAQCRTFPFWPYYRKHKEELSTECIGVYF